MNINSDINVDDVFFQKTSFKGYLKWHNSVVGVINEYNEVKFINRNHNIATRIYIRNKDFWTTNEFNAFLTDRVISKDRRDINKVLARCNITSYDVFEIGYITRAFNPRDSFWISFDVEEKMEDVIGSQFKDMFSLDFDTDGNPIRSPDGQNEKIYVRHGHNYGIYKKRINQSSTDVESEVAVSNLCNLLGVPCCDAELVENYRKQGNKKVRDNMVFSNFEYNFVKESIVHIRRFLSEEERELYNFDEYKMLKDKLPKFKIDIAKLIIADFLTRQDDRHWSNFAIKINEDGEEEFYPLYDNGRSLFFENNEEFIEDALNDMENYCTGFGESGTYYDYVNDISKEYKISSLVNLNITREAIIDAYEESGLKGFKLKGAVEWTYRCLQYLKTL